MDWPLIGRDEQLRAFQRLLGSPRPPVLVLAGPAGVGKTRLASACLALAERRGHATASIRATRSATAIPFGAASHLVTMDDVVDGDRAAALRRAVRRLEEQAGDRTLVLAVDDAHLLDEATSALLPLVAASERVLPLLTIRSDEPVPEAVASVRDVGERVELPPLSDDDVQAVLEGALGGPVDDPTAERFAATTRGNALFLRELVDAAVAAGTLVERGGTWRLDGGLVTTDRLLELVRARVGHLDGVERAALEVVALGEPVGLAVLERIVGPDVAPVVAASDVLTVELDGKRVGVRLAHPLFGEAVRTDLPTLRAIQLRRALADATIATGARRREDALRIATWQLDAGEPGDPATMVAAARLARAAADFDLAARLVTAVDAGFDARLLHAEILALQGRSDDANALLFDLAAAAGSDRERGAVAAMQADIAVHGSRWPSWILEALDAAAASIGDPEWLEQLAARRALLVMMVEGPAAAAMPEPPAGSSAAAVVGAIVAGWTAAVDLRPHDADRIAAVAVAAHRQHPLLWHRTVHDVYRCQAQLLAGNLDDARAVATALHARSVADRQPTLRAWFAWLVARVELLAGSVAVARAFADEALRLSHRMGRLLAERWAVATVVEAAAMASDVAAASAALAELDGLDLPDTGILAAENLRARAWTAAAARDSARAWSLLDEAASLARSSGEPATEAFALVDLVRLRRPGDAVERLNELADARPVPLVRAFAAYATAVAARDGEAIEAAASTLEALGARLLAAEGYAAAAEAHIAGNRSRRAALPERRSAELLAGCTGARPPTIAGTRAMARLTDREREIGAMAAAGRSNREIADQLSISVRTVENQLHRVYEKLGLGSRDELADVFGL